MTDLNEENGWFRIFIWALVYNRDGEPSRVPKMPCEKLKLIKVLHKKELCCFKILVIRNCKDTNYINFKNDNIPYNFKLIIVNIYSP